MRVVYLKNRSWKPHMFITRQTTKCPDNQHRLKPLCNKNKNLEPVPEFVPDLYVFQMQSNKMHDRQRHKTYLLLQMSTPSKL